ncbi:MAG: hypothetical protein WDN50_25110 [Bradyrhizobium sp.]
MLFNSYLFIFLFLPIALVGYFALGRLGQLAPVSWLALASLAFYAASGWPFVALLLASIAFNYAVGWLLIARRLSGSLRVIVLTGGRLGRSRRARLFQIFRFPRRQSRRGALDQL